MSPPVLEAKAFQDENAAYAWVEARVWPEGPVCPHCGGTERIGKLQGKSTRVGVYKCYQCRKPFTVKVGTVFEDSHVPMRFWLQAMYLLCSSKKGISSNQLHRTLGVTLKTAWFMSHRLREAMRVVGVGPLGGEGQTVEADETFIGRLEGQPKRRAGWAHKNAVGGEFASHESVNHGREEYVRGHVHTNTVEGFYSIFKRGMKGIYQHCSEKHLHRYLAEYDFRYSNRIRLGVDDLRRTEIAIKGIVGKRLTYR
jgi:transposase-like protein